MSLVSWGDCCQTLSNGGLGIRRFKEKNDSFMLKLGFNLLTNKEALWVKVFQAKYKITEVILDDICRSKYFFVWRSLSK
ncbi:hypothetical protein J1N35_015083, partial [Gossypium stocksii]